MDVASSQGRDGMDRYTGSVNLEQEDDLHQMQGVSM